MELVSGSKFRALVAWHKICSFSCCVEHLTASVQPMLGHPTEDEGSSGTWEAVGEQEGVAAPGALLSWPVSVCKLPPIVLLLFRSSQFCVPSQLKIRFCLHSGQRPWTLLRKSTEETGHRVDCKSKNVSSSAPWVWKHGAGNGTSPVFLCLAGV